MLAVRDVVGPAEGALALQRRHDRVDRVVDEGQIDAVLPVADLRQPAHARARDELRQQVAIPGPKRPWGAG